MPWNFHSLQHSGLDVSDGLKSRKKEENMALIQLLKHTLWTPRARRTNQHFKASIESGVVDRDTVNVHSRAALLSHTVHIHSHIDGWRYTRVHLCEFNHSMDCDHCFLHIRRKLATAVHQTRMSNYTKYIAWVNLTIYHPYSVQKTASEK